VRALADETGLVTDAYSYDARLVPDGLDPRQEERIKTAMATDPHSRPRSVLTRLMKRNSGDCPDFYVSAIRYEEVAAHDLSAQMLGLPRRLHVGPRALQNGKISEIEIASLLSAVLDNGTTARDITEISTGTSIHTLPPSKEV